MNGPEIDGLTELYSLIVSIDHVERAYVRDSISADDYESVISRLMTQYSKESQDPQIRPFFLNLDSFVSEFNIQAAAGVNRLKIGIPATAEALSVTSFGKAGNKSGAKAAAVASGNFITFCDGVEVGYRSKSDLHPLLMELMVSLSKVTKSDFDGRGRMVQWLIKLNQLEHTECLTDEQAKECLEAVGHGYSVFLNLLD